MLLGPEASQCLLNKQQGQGCGLPGTWEKNQRPRVARRGLLRGELA